MTRAITHIEQDIEDLEQELIAIAQELGETYVEYLAVLSDAVQQQVILTTYRLCTQGYPQRFLKLSVGDRQQLQQAIQALARKTRQDLLNPAQLDALTAPFSKETDGTDKEQDDEQESDIMLRHLSAFVRRMLAEESQRDDDEQDVDGPFRRLSNRANSDGDDSDEEEDDRPSNRLEALIIPENVALDFLADAQFVYSEDDEDDEDDYAEDEGEDDLDISGFSVHLSFADDDADSDADAGDLDHPSSPERHVLNMGHVARNHAIHQGAASDPESTADVNATANDAANNAPSSNLTSQQLPAIPPLTPVQPTPKALIRRCERLEKQIHKIVKQATDKINELLQSSGILPKKLPDAVLEAVLKSELSSSGDERSPNVLNLLVETNGESDKPKLMQVMAVRLRVEELEFNNPTLMAWRSRIRELAAQLRTFEKSYRKLQREKSVADAEATWRSTWYESDG